MSVACESSLSSSEGAQPLLRPLNLVVRETEFLALPARIQAKPGTPLWRRDETGRSFALKLTAAGLKAIAVDERPKEANEPGEASQPQLLPEAKNGVSLDDVGRHAPTAAPRDGSKLALMIDLLRRADETPYDLASEFSSPMSTYRM